jgi:hypothetical protein
MIVAKQATEAHATVDCSVRWELGKFRPNNFVLEFLMIAFPAIVQNEL